MQKPVATYAPLALSGLVVLVIAIGWLVGRLDTTTAIEVIGAVLAGNGLVSATQWQAAPGVVGDLQTIIGQLMGHIQTLHAQQTQAVQVAQPIAPVSTAPTPSPALDPDAATSPMKAVVVAKANGG